MLTKEKTDQSSLRPVLSGPISMGQSHWGLLTLNSLKCQSRNTQSSAAPAMDAHRCLNKLQQFLCFCFVH